LSLLAPGSIPIFYQLVNAMRILSTRQSARHCLSTALEIYRKAHHCGLHPLSGRLARRDR